jgi:hypothetical protein
MSNNALLRELVRLHGGDVTVGAELLPLTAEWVRELEAFTMADLEALPERPRE